jgi:hypothetical protein
MFHASELTSQASETIGKAKFTFSASTLLRHLESFSNEILNYETYLEELNLNLVPYTLDYCSLRAVRAVSENRESLGVILYSII